VGGFGVPSGIDEGAGDADADNFESDEEGA